MLLIVRDALLFILTIGGLALPLMRLADRHDPMERVGFGLGAALVAIYLFATLIYLSGADSRWRWIFPFAGLLGGLCSRREMIALWYDPGIRTAGSGWLMLAAWCLALTALITSHAGGGWAGDWYEHYERTLFFLQNWPTDYLFIAHYPLPARPPLTNLVTSAFLGLGSPDYPRFQVITCLLCTLVYWPLLNICRMFGGGRLSPALLTLALMLNPLFVQNATFPWTKLPAAFFVLTAIPPLMHSLRKPGDRRYLPLAACWLAAGTLAHYSGAVWLVALAAGWLVASRGSASFRMIFRQITEAGLAATLLLGTWFGWALTHYGTDLTFRSNTTVNASLHSNSFDILATFASNLFHTILPHPWPGTSDPWLWQSDAVAKVADWFFQFYQQTLSLGWGCAGLVLHAMIWRHASCAKAPERERYFWWSALMLAGVLGIGTHTQRSAWGLIHISLQPLVLLGLAWLTVHLPGIWIKLNPWPRRTVLALATVDLVGGIVLHFVVQNTVATRFNQLSFAIQTNYAGKLRLGQPFLADVVGASWGPSVALAGLLGLACWRVIATGRSSRTFSVATPAGPKTRARPEIF